MRDRSADPSGRSTDGEEGGKGDRGREVRYSCRKYALKDEEKDAVKAGVLAILKENYGMEEDDFMSAELEVVRQEEQEKWVLTAA